MDFSLSRMANSLSFAHLARIGARVCAADDDDPPPDPPAERDREDGAHANARAEDGGATTIRARPSIRSRSPVLPGSTIAAATTTRRSRCRMTR